jgi:hypothetical protein
MGYEGSLQCSHKPVTGLYPQSDESVHILEAQNSIAHSIFQAPISVLPSQPNVSIL